MSAPATTTPFRLTKELSLQDFLKANKARAHLIQEAHPEVYPINAAGQSPHTLWIGCSDLRVLESALGVLPGEVFTLRNIANVVLPGDVSLTGAIQFAVDVLKVKKIVVCGHTECGGIYATLLLRKIGGVLDHWLAPVRLVRALHRKELEAIENPLERCRRLSELNAIHLAVQVKHHPLVADAIKRGDVEVWAVVYDVANGELYEVEIHEDEHEDLYHVQDAEDEHH